MGVDDIHFFPPENPPQTHHTPEIEPRLSAQVMNGESIGGQILAQCANLVQAEVNKPVSIPQPPADPRGENLRAADGQTMQELADGLHDCGDLFKGNTLRYWVWHRDPELYFSSF